MANEEYIDVKFDIFEYTDQRARVRRSLTVSTLIEEILREFDDIPSDPSNRYVLYLKGIDKPLDNNKSLIELDIQPQDELVFDRHRAFLRRDLPADVNAYFVEEKTSEVYEVQWVPAVIGRSSADMDHNFSLAVNLQFAPGGKSISRRHAQVLFSDGKFYLESLAENNPVFLNGKEMASQKRFEVRDGDKIMLGFNRVTLTFKRRKVSGATQRGTTSATAEEAPRVQQQEEQASETQILGFSAPLNYPGKPQLIIETANSPEIIGKAISLDVLPCVLGRTLPLLTSENDMSRSHAEISCDPQSRRYYIRDLNSTNGVAVNGQPIRPDTPVEITPGSHIRLGIKVHVRFEA